MCTWTRGSLALAVLVLAMIHTSSGKALGEECTGEGVGDCDAAIGSNITVICNATCKCNRNATQIRQQCIELCPRSGKCQTNGTICVTPMVPIGKRHICGKQCGETGCAKPESPTCTWVNASKSVCKCGNVTKCHGGKPFCDKSSLGGHCVTKLKTIGRPPIAADKADMENKFKLVGSEPDESTAKPRNDAAGIHAVVGSIALVTCAAALVLGA